MTANDFNELFDQLIDQYHIKDTVDQDFSNPYDKSTLKHLLYRNAGLTPCNGIMKISLDYQISIL